MKVSKLIMPVVAIYLLGMVLFWLCGKGTSGWNLYFYSLEKLFTASGFLLLALSTHSRLVLHVSLYAVSICVYMFLYYIYCLFFDHSNGLAITSFLMYSIIILYLLYKNTKQ